MKKTKKYFRRLKIEIQELMGMLSIRELVSNRDMTRQYELVHQQLLRWI